VMSSLLNGSEVAGAKPTLPTAREAHVPEANALALLVPFLYSGIAFMLYLYLRKYARGY
jgi:hypothetical protein